MVEETQEEDKDHEGDALERVSRIRQWWDLIMSVKKTIAMLLGIAGISVAGNINGTNYWEQAACEVGVIDCIELEAEEAIVEEMIEPPEVEVAEPAIEHTQHPHKPKKHSHPEYATKEHTHSSPVTNEEIKDLIRDALKDVVPVDHMKLH